MKPSPDTLAEMAGVSWFDYQLSTFDGWLASQDQRALLYYRTGAGKSLTALAMLKLKGFNQAVVITPPSTNDSWLKTADDMNMSIVVMSHAMFRQKKTKLSRHIPIVADEFHLFGGHTGQGWKKMDTLARHLQAPLLLCSATPNYNDAERVYCIKHVLEPHKTKGGYLEFLYANCVTKHNPFGATPLLDEDTPFRNFKDAAEYLNSLVNVYYVEDNVVFTIEEHDVMVSVPDEFEEYGYKRRDHKLMASGMEKRHALIDLQLIDDDGYINLDVWGEIITLAGQSTTPVLIFSNHSTVADALAMMFDANNMRYLQVDGSVSTKEKARRLKEFKTGRYDFLLGTASLATGTDGLDKMCDTLIILDDTDDDALRRQLIGRIMPRGIDIDSSMKRVHRINVS